MADPDRDLVLGRLRDREAAIRAHYDARIAAVGVLVDRLDAKQNVLSADVAEGVDELRDATQHLTEAVMHHIQAEAIADARRDALLCEHASLLASAAGKVGGKAGAVWGAVAAGIITAFAPAVAALFKAVFG